MFVLTDIFVFSQWLSINEIPVQGVYRFDHKHIKYIFRQEARSLDIFT